MSRKLLGVRSNIHLEVLPAISVKDFPDFFFVGFFPRLSLRFAQEYYIKLFLPTIIFSSHFLVFLLEFFKYSSWNYFLWGSSWNCIIYSCNDSSKNSFWNSSGSPPVVSSGVLSGNLRWYPWRIPPSIPPWNLQRFRQQSKFLQRFYQEFLQVFC